MKITNYFTAFFLIFFALSCSESPISSNAEKMTLQEIKKISGFQWFNSEWSSYETNSEFVDSMRTVYDPLKHTFLLFVKPSCTCPGIHNYFPKFAKALDAAGVNESNYEIFMMNSINNNHPNEDIVDLNFLPAFYVLKYGNPVYSVMDTFDLRATDEMTPILEELIFEGLQK
ncbi:MAG: hypothetical protein ACOC2K_02685 [Bacteroidota bacterium]